MASRISNTQTHESPVTNVPVRRQGCHHLFDTIKKISHVSALEVIADRVSLCKCVCMCNCAGARRKQSDGCIIIDTEPSVCT